MLAPRPRAAPWVADEPVGAGGVERRCAQPVSAKGTAASNPGPRAIRVPAGSCGCCSHVRSSPWPVQRPQIVSWGRARRRLPARVRALQRRGAPLGWGGHNGGMPDRTLGGRLRVRPRTTRHGLTRTHRVSGFGHRWRYGDLLRPAEQEGSGLPAPGATPADATMWEGARSSRDNGTDRSGEARFGANLVYSPGRFL